VAASLTKPPGSSWLLLCELESGTRERGVDSASTLYSNLWHALKKRCRVRVLTSALLPLLPLLLLLLVLQRTVYIDKPELGYLKGNQEIPAGAAFDLEVEVLSVL
jgi:hypothetical protein